MISRVLSVLREIERENCAVDVFDEGTLPARPAFDVPRFVLVRALRNDSTRMIERLRAEMTARGRAAAALPAGDEP